MHSFSSKPKEGRERNESLAYQSMLSVTRMKKKEKKVFSFILIHAELFPIPYVYMDVTKSLNFGALLCDLLMPSSP